MDKQVEQMMVSDNLTRLEMAEMIVRMNKQLDQLKARVDELELALNRSCRIALESASNINHITLIRQTNDVVNEQLDVLNRIPAQSLLLHDAEVRKQHVREILKRIGKPTDDAPYEGGYRDCRCDVRRVDAQLRKQAEGE